MPKTIFEKEQEALLGSYATEVSQLCYRVNALESASCENESESKSMYRLLAKKLDEIPGDEGETLKKILAGFKK